jgi:hypothetical protein
MKSTRECTNMTIKENPNWIAKMLLFAGLIEVVVGLLHFVIPISTYHSNGLGSLGDDEINFVTASIFAVGILLVAFGALTIEVSRKSELWKGLLLPFFKIKALLWCGRVVLEIIFPVTIPLFYFQRPTTVVMPLLILEASLFVISYCKVSR